MGIVLRLGPHSENTAELLRFQKWFSQQKEGGEEVNDSEGSVKYSEDSLSL